MKTQTELLNEKTEALNASMINCNATVKTVLSNLIDKTAGIARSLSDGSGNISSNEISCINDTLNDIQETTHNIYDEVASEYIKDTSFIDYISSVSADAILNSDGAVTENDILEIIQNENNLEDRRAEFIKRLNSNFINTNNLFGLNKRGTSTYECIVKNLPIPKENRIGSTANGNWCWEHEAYNGQIKCYKASKKLEKYKKALKNLKNHLEYGCEWDIEHTKGIQKYSINYSHNRLIPAGSDGGNKCCRALVDAAASIAEFIETWCIYYDGHDLRPQVTNAEIMNPANAYCSGKIADGSVITFRDIENDIADLQQRFQNLLNSHKNMDLHKVSTDIRYINEDTDETIHVGKIFEDSYADSKDDDNVKRIMVSAGYLKHSIRYNPDYINSVTCPLIVEDENYDYSTEPITCIVSGKKAIDSEKHVFNDAVINKKENIQILTGGLKLEPFDDFSLDEDGCGITVQKEGYSKSYSSARFAVPFVDPHNSHPMQFDFEHEAEYKEKINIKIKIELYDITNEKISDETNEIKEEYISYTSKSERASEIKKIEDFYNDVAEKYIPTSSDDKKFTKMDNKSPVEIKTASDIIGSSTINITYRFKKREKVCTVSIYDNNELIQTSDIWFNDKLPIPNSYIVDNEHEGSIMAKYGTEFLIKKSLTHEWFFNPCKEKTPIEDIRLDVKYLGLLRMGANTVFYSWINGKTERERLRNPLVKWDIDSISPKTQKTYISELKAYMSNTVKKQVIDHVKSKFNEDISENQIKIDNFYTIDPLVEVASIKPNEIPETKIYYDFLVKDISNKNTITYASNIEGIYSNKVEVDDGDQITEFPYTEDYEDANGNIYLFDHTEPTLPITINNKDQTVTGHWVEPKYFYESPVYFGLNIKFWIDKSENRVYDYDGSIDGVKSFVEKVYKEYYIKNGQKVYTGRYKTEKGKIKKYDNGWHWSITLPPKGTTVSTGWFSSAEVNRWQITDLDSGSVAEYEGGRKINIAYNHWYKELPQIDTTTIQVEVEAIIGPEPPKYKVSYESNISINPMPESFETKEVESGTIISEFPYTEDVTIDGKTYKFDHTEPSLPITITKDTTITGIWIEKENGENGEGHIPEILDWKPFGYYVGIAKFWYNYEDAVVFNPESIECSAEIGAFYYNDENGNEIITGYTDSSAEKLKQSPYIEGLGLNEITLPMIESGTVYNIEGIEITINNPRWSKVGSNETFAPGEKVKIDWSSEEPYPITNFVLECD